MDVIINLANFVHELYNMELILCVLMHKMCTACLLCGFVNDREWTIDSTVDDSRYVPLNQLNRLKESFAIIKCYKKGNFRPE